MKEPFSDSDLQNFIRHIHPADRTVMDAARKRQAELAKPPGSLGKLEDYAIALAGITGDVYAVPERSRILVFAADNGVTAEGVSSAPPSVTRQQTVNMTHFKTGMSSMARYFGCEVDVTDVGVNGGRLPETVLNRKIRSGTGNIVREAAMTRAEALTAISVGMERAEQAARDGVQLVGIGEMGIGNTTTSAAVLAALTGADARQVTGRGGGLTDAAFRRKRSVIDTALRLHQPDDTDAVDVLSKVGGLDLAAMTGAFLGCAAHRLPAVVDGYISVVAALCACRLCPAVRDYLFLSHASQEPGYRLAAEELGLVPCLLLGMRLGEGSGCPVMFQVLKAACAAQRDMASFAEADIEDDYLDEIRRIDAFTVTP